MQHTWAGDLSPLGMLWMLPVLPAVCSCVTEVLLQDTLTTCPCLCWWALSRAHGDLKRRQETGYSWALWPFLQRPIC